ncbi:MAG TPA: outer membrane beta-barrel family protein [Ferruginibacter sp.]|nr:outer membrane beta-barrel family protein [Ferruginibacter sp.]HRO96381.1 outer membrane beta-barrel family protein [Ferruginibacter sp.]
MLKKFFLLLLIAFNLQTSFAQSNFISGKVRDTTEQTSIKNAVVVLLDAQDSTFIDFTRTKADGSFQLSKAKTGNYIFMVTHPMFADYVEDISYDGSPRSMGTVAMTPKSKLLQEVIVKSGSPIRIKGDTTIYTADSFAVGPNANVEELLKKLPGIQVDKNGQIKAMGQTVERVLVDGEEFFGDDPGMAVKNLRADAVKEVQVFDKKSEQAEFTGIDDGNTQKTINLKLKEDKKKGYFGKIDVSGAPQKDIPNRFNNNLMLSSFKGKRKISAFLLNGNTGQDGLSWQDNEKFGGASDNITTSVDEETGAYIVMQTSGGTDGEPYVNTRNGFITNINAGIQYSNKWKDKHTLNFSPRYNYQDYENNVLSFNQTSIGDSILIENVQSKQDVKRHNYKNNATYDLKIDSNSSLRVTVRANFYHTESADFREGTNISSTGVLKNETSRSLQTVSDKQAYGATAIFKHKFKKPRRTLTFTGDYSNIQSESNSTLISNNTPYFNGSPTGIIEQNQQRVSDVNNTRFSGKLMYTEPISKRYSVQFEHETSVISGRNDQTTFSFSQVTGKYDVPLDSLTNDFEQLIIEQRPGVRLSYNTKKIIYNFGANVALVDFNLTNNSLNTKYDRNFTNFFPAANFTYKYKTNAQFRLNYNGATRQPTVNQLQPINNNNDYFNQYVGNPDLKTAFAHNVGITHNSYNFLKEMWMYQSVNLSVENNSITNSRTIDLDSGKTVIRPINTDGNINLNVWTGMGFKWKKPNININFQPNANYSRFVEVINNRRTFANNLRTGLGIYLQKDKDKKYELSVGTNFSYNRNTTAFNLEPVEFMDNNLSVSARVFYKKVWSLQTEYNYDWRQKTDQFSESLNINLWNARLQRTFAKDAFTAYVLIRDILNQNIGISRNAYSNTLSETRNDRLRRYFMVGFAWNFKNK